MNFQPAVWRKRFKFWRERRHVTRQKPTLLFSILALKVSKDGKHRTLQEVDRVINVICRVQRKDCDVRSEIRRSVPSLCKRMVT